MDTHSAVSTHNVDTYGGADREGARPPLDARGGVPRPISSSFCFQTAVGSPTPHSGALESSAQPRGFCPPFAPATATDDGRWPTPRPFDTPWTPPLACRPMLSTPFPVPLHQHPVGRSRKRKMGKPQPPAVAGGGGMGKCGSPNSYGTAGRGPRRPLRPHAPRGRGRKRGTSRG